MKRTLPALEQAGFRMIETDGGCTAFCLDNLRLGSYILITDAEDPSAPESMDQPCVVGFYPGPDHTEAAFTFAATPAQVVALKIKVEP